MMGKSSVFRQYSRTFWASNLIELFERWAWYGFYLALALFLVNSKDTGALGFTQAQKGLIMGTGSMLLYFLPVITGAIADKVGYKKILYLSFAVYISGFFMMRSSDSFGMAFFSFIWICIGGALFKPIISAMIARTTNSETASIGFGIFYMMVNIGGFIGPFISGMILKKGWDYVFFMSIAVLALNYIVTIFFFKEPVVRAEGESIGKSIGQAFVNIWITIQNWRYVIFLLIMSLFWAAFNQLYYSFPVFVEEWADTSGIYRLVASLSPSAAETIGNGWGGISTVTFSSMDSFFIICFQLVVSSFVMRFRPLHAMMGGILVLAVGLGLMFSGRDGWIVLFGVLIFGLGEMASSPKYTEYIGRIAPIDQKALYIGTSYLPFALGHQLAGWLSGSVYEGISDKLFLLKKEVARLGLQIPDISESFSKNEYIGEAARQMGMNGSELSGFLWANYHPGNIWMVYSGIALSSSALLYLYNRYILPPKK
ncbi:MAG: MFS transporter [Prolixibacteraceae bacterium]|jgi:dipeptide/tripeptide permease|nr:MFS transporter [Prolixibacteraceae bacterium]